jgi:formate hydrogenlyase transcriptional activator
MVLERRFRADLFYRLNVYAIPIPPLRERRDDIPLLTAQFIRMLAPRMNKEVREIAEEALERLKRHDWPGNVRELRNFIERAIIHTSGPRLEIPPEEFRADSDAKAGTTQTLADAERCHILSVLDQTNGVVSGRNGAALRLGLPRTTLMYRMHKLGIVQKRIVAGEQQSARSKNGMRGAS